MAKDTILQSIYNNEFKNFKNNQSNRKSVSDSDSDSYRELEYNLSEIHPINIKEFKDEGYFLIACTQACLDEIDWVDFEIWKVYKTDKHYHVLEFSNNKRRSLNMINNRNDFTSDYSLYNYYDYDKLDDEPQLWRKSTPVIGMKLPQDFEL